MPISFCSNGVNNASIHHLHLECICGQFVLHRAHISCFFNRIPLRSAVRVCGAGSHVASSWCVAASEGESMWSRVSCGFLLVCGRQWGWEYAERGLMWLPPDVWPPVRVSVCGAGSYVASSWCVAASEGESMRSGVSRGFLLMCGRQWGWEYVEQGLMWLPPDVWPPVRVRVCGAGSHVASSWCVAAGEGESMWSGVSCGFLLMCGRQWGWEYVEQGLMWLPLDVWPPVRVRVCGAGSHVASSWCVAANECTRYGMSSILTSPRNYVDFKLGGRECKTTGVVRPTCALMKLQPGPLVTKREHILLANLTVHSRSHEIWIKNIPIASPTWQAPSLNLKAARDNNIPSRGFGT